MRAHAHTQRKLCGKDKYYFQVKGDEAPECMAFPLGIPVSLSVEHSL